MLLDFDLFAPEVLADPYPLYHKLRAEAPVFRAPQGQLVLTRYDDVLAALHNSRGRRSIGPGLKLPFFRLGGWVA
jgi:cytochrome P450